MKPFDLEAAKRGEPIVTRDGREAKFIAHVPEAIPQQRVVVLQDRDVVTIHENGCFSVNAALARDIFMAPKKRTVWVNLYQDDEGIKAFAHETELESNDHSRLSQKRIGGKAYPVEIEE